MRTEEQIMRRIEGVKAMIQGYKMTGKDDVELYVGLVSELHTLEWVMSEDKSQ